MAERARLSWGAEAGILGGIAVAAIFFVGDVVHMAPLSTPTALGRTFFGPGGTQMSGAMPDGALAMAVFAGNLVAFSVLHLLTFAFLGIGAVVLFNAMHWRLTAVSGALYGLLVCSAVFYLSLTLGAGALMEGLPGPLAVGVANGVAGGLIGGGVQFMQADVGA